MDLNTIFILTAILNTLIFISLFLFIKLSIVRNKVFDIYTYGKLIQAIGWVLLILRGIAPDIVSIGIANSLIILGFGAETFSISSYNKKNLKHRAKIFSIIAVVFVVVFLVLTNFKGSIRIAYMSLVFFIWLIIASQQLIVFSKKNKLQLAAGIIFGFFSLFAITRSFFTLFIFKTDLLLDANIIQSITYSALFLFNFVSVLLLLLLLKEQDEETIKLSGEKFKIFTELLPQIVFEVNNKGQIFYLNKQAFKLTGFSPRDFKKGLNISDVFVKEDLERVLKNFKATMSGEGQIGTEYSVQKKNGEQFPVLIYSSPIIEDNKVLGLRGIIVDITNSKKTEQEIQKLSTAVEQSSNTIVITDIKGNIEYTNPKFEDLTGYTAQEALGENPRILNAGTQPKEYYANMWKVITAGKTWKGEFHNKKKNGDYFWENVTITPIKDNEGKVVNYLAIKEDITDRILVEKALKESEERLRLAQNAGKIGTWEWDIETDKILWSDMTYKIFGLQKTKNPITGDEYFKYVHPDDKEKLIAELDSAIKNNKEEHKTEYRIINNKEISWIEETSRIVRDKAGKFAKMIGVLQDITDRKKAELALIESEAKLQESNKTKDKFFSIIAHDLKSPFTSVLGFSELLINNYNEYDAQQHKEFIGIIHQGVQNTHKLLENLLLWSQAQSGIIDYKPEKNNLYLLSSETIILLSQLLADKSINLINEIPQDICVNADKNMLLTILRNLLSNAIKFTPKGGGIVIGARTIKKESNQSYIEISVKDNGVGIPPEIQSGLFKIAENVSTKGTENEQGTGRGLILCKEFVEKHGGEIWVESKVENGSEFKFTIPLV